MPLKTMPTFISLVPATVYLVTSVLQLSCDYDLDAMPLYTIPTFLSLIPATVYLVTSVLGLNCNYDSDTMTLHYGLYFYPSYLL
jgi:hypothetical protein